MAGVGACAFVYIALDGNKTGSLCCTPFVSFRLTQLILEYFHGVAQSKIRYYRADSAEHWYIHVLHWYTKYTYIIYIYIWWLLHPAIVT